MFIKSSGSGYSRGEQFARGSFLILFSHNGHKWEEQNNRARVECHGETTDGKVCQCRGSEWRAEHGETGVPAYYLKYCPVHSSEYRAWKGDNRKLYACVRHVSLRQCGHSMMGTARIAGQSVTVSGSHGADGLPRDYESLTETGRVMLTEVPREIADVYWNGDGWNGAGNEADVMRAWALATFKGGK